MPRNSYQYGTNPRKYETEYTTGRMNKKATAKRSGNKKTVKKNEAKKVVRKSDAKKRIEKQRAKKAQERKSKVLQVVVVFAIFGMLLAVSYREIAIMEMFNQKKELENQLAAIDKENGQVEKSIKEVESTLDWNSIQQKATEELGMQKKTGTPVDLDKTDNVETKSKLIKEEETSIIEKIVSYFINK